MEQDAPNSGLALQADCCDTLSFSIEGQDNLNTGGNAVELQQQSLVAVLPLSLLRFSQLPTLLLRPFKVMPPLYYTKTFKSSTLLF